MPPGKGGETRSQPYVSILSRLFNRTSGREALAPLYAAVVAEARDPAWYREGGVPDTIDGRFDMVTAVLSVALARLEREGAHQQAAFMTEIFVEDMDGQLRQLGIGDIVVGKHIGKMMSALGGRLSAYRAGLAGEEPLEDALTRNLYRGEAPDGAALAFATARMRALAERVDRLTLDTLLGGSLG